MSRHNDIGKLGEKIALEYLLLNKKYLILETNWRFCKAEIDIIAKVDETLIFFEVKTRSYDYYGKPEEFITSRKEELIQDAASEYMKTIGHEWAIQFDIISILLKNETEYKVEHFEDAWF